MGRQGILAGVWLGIGLLSGCGGGPGTGIQPPAPGPVEDATGAVRSVEASELESGHFANLAEFLKTRAPGLEVVELPSGEISLRIRGGNLSLMGEGGREPQPLVVIDDMPVDPSTVSATLKALRPQEIQSVRVLRDVASTSVYGTRGANGVILIRMKKGS